MGSPIPLEEDLMKRTITAIAAAALIGLSGTAAAQGAGRGQERNSGNDRGNSGHGFVQRDSRGVGDRNSGHDDHGSNGYGNGGRDNGHGSNGNGQGSYGGGGYGGGGYGNGHGYSYDNHGYGYGGYGSYGRPPVYAPPSWRRGDRLPPAYWGPHYRVMDYPHYHVYAPPYGYQWVHVNNELLLTALATGLVLDVVYNSGY
jgi:Ni/Co efflux regulator RcnB